MFPQPPMGDFGNKFRKARENKELSLDDVSNVTKISARMLRAIEEERFDQLPGGVFNKGFIRAYAKHLGLNSEDAVTEYLACLRQAQIDSHEGWDPESRTSPQAVAPPKSAATAPAKSAAKVQAPVEAAVEEELPHLQLPRAEHIRPARKEFLDRPSSGISGTFIAVALVIVIAAAALWIRHSRNARSVAANSNTPAVKATATPAATTTATQSPSVPRQATLSTASTAPAPRPATPNPQITSPTPATTRTAAPALPTPVAADANQVRVEKKGDVTIRSFGDSTTKPAERPVATLSLVIRASENSWISVTADGQLVTQETLIAPAHTSVHASHEIVARIGNAAGISFTWNGQDIPVQGTEAEVKTFTFDAQGMHVTSAPQNP